MSDLYTEAEAEAWADGIGAALLAYWTEDLGHTVFTHRELLQYANPAPHLEDIETPERADALWDAAMALLRERDVIAE